MEYNMLMLQFTTKKMVEEILRRTKKPTYNS